MDRMMSTPLAAKERGITHRISKDRADFWKEEQNQPKDKKDNHTGLLTACLQDIVPPTHSMPAIHCVSKAQECDTRRWLLLKKDFGPVADAAQR